MSVYDDILQAAATASDAGAGTRFSFGFPFDDTGEFDEAVHKAMRNMLDTYKIVSFSNNPPNLLCVTGDDGVARKGFWIGATVEVDSEGEPVMRQQSATVQGGGE